MRVAVGKVGHRTLAAPLSRGAGIISSLVRADGLVVIPAGSQGLPAGEEVEVRLLRPPSAIERTLFAIGSHDMTLDLMAQFLMERNRRLSSTNVGSLGGLISLRRGEAHIAGTHLLDPETGEYNLSYIRQYLPQIPVRLLAFVEREQGLIVEKGNPKAIVGLEDLSRDDVQFINRQRGSGTRVLLDYHLDLLDISSSSVHGYDHEEYTHLSVAAAVLSGRADCGMGIEAAARALDLDFIPLYRERYDLVVPLKFVNDTLLTPFFELLQDPNFRKVVSELPGYHVVNMGEILADFDFQDAVE
jgi:putative molybdopterin biosynthesis protein